MTDMTQNIYYKRLANLALWPIVIFLGFVLVIVVSEILVFYLKYVPDLLMPVQQSVSTRVLASLDAGINKIIIYLSVWIFALFVVNVALTYVVWNIKKLLLDLEKSREK